MVNLIILGAGKPYEGSVQPSLLQVNKNTRILDWILNAYKDVSLDTCQFVGGYKYKEVFLRYPDLRFIINKKWESSSPLESLLLAQLDSEKENFISYSDIIYEPETIIEMNKDNSDIVLSCDLNWKNRYKSRSKYDVKNAEKIYFDKNNFKKITTDNHDMEGTAEFCGIIKLSKKVTSFINNNLDKEELSKNYNLLSFINFLKEKSFTVKLIDVQGKWAELNNKEDLAQFILGTKAEALSRLKPQVKNGLIGESYYFTYQEWLDNQKKIIEDIQSFSKKNQLIVRSSSSSEDLLTASNAGKFESILGVDPKDQKNLVKSIDKVFKSYTDIKDFDQVLIQAMLKDVFMSGVIITRTLDHGAPYYVVNYEISSDTESVTSGNSNDLKTVLIRRELNINAIENKIIRKIISAVKEIESLLENDSLDIEFAVNQNDSVNILQVRSIALKDGFKAIDDDYLNKIIRNVKDEYNTLNKNKDMFYDQDIVLGRMPDWNPAEIIGTKPNALSKSLYEYLIMDDVWAKQRYEYGYKDLRNNKLMKSLHHHVFVDVRASFNSFIPHKLSKRFTKKLMNYYLNKLKQNPENHDKVEFEILFTCFDFDINERLKDLKVSAGFSSKEIDDMREALFEITQKQFPRSSEHLSKLKILEENRLNILNSNIGVVDKLKSLLNDAKNYGTLPFAHLARNGFVATSLLKSLNRLGVLSEDDIENFYKSLNTITFQMEVDGYKLAKNEISKDDYIKKYGHLRPGTYEILTPSYKNNFEGYLSHLTKDPSNAMPVLRKFLWKEDQVINIQKILDRTLKWTFKEFDLYLRAAISGRELAKLEFTKNLSIVLECIQSWGKRYLSLEPSDLTHLRINEILKDEPVAKKRENCMKIIDNEKENKQIASFIEFPDLIFEEKDIDCHFRDSGNPNFGTHQTLTRNLVVHESKDLFNKELQDSIILIEQADPGYDWLFSKNIGGLITKYGGANSHMTIRCSELGIPAAIGVGDSIYDNLKNAKKISLDCQNQKIEIL